MDLPTVKKNNNLLEIARLLRKNMTEQENHLWYDFLQHYPIKIYKQRIIDDFVADFYCHQARLVIELDGSQHYTPEGKKYDAFRTEIMERYGIEVIRFLNRDIDNNFEGVCYVIDKTIKRRIEELPSQTATQPAPPEWEPPSQTATQPAPPEWEPPSQTATQPAPPEWEP